MMTMEYWALKSFELICLSFRPWKKSDLFKEIAVISNKFYLKQVRFPWPYNIFFFSRGKTFAISSSFCITLCKLCRIIFSGKYIDYFQPNLFAPKTFFLWIKIVDHWYIYNIAERVIYQQLFSCTLLVCEDTLQLRHRSKDRWDLDMLTAEAGKIRRYLTDL